MADQDEAQPVISAGLLRALAEAADGHRTESDVYFVARYEPSGLRYEMTGPFTDKQEAHRVAKEKNEAYRRESSGSSNGRPMYGCFGPYRTWDGVKPKVRIVNIDLELERDAGSGKRMLPRHRIEGHKFDALFYSLSALEKFAIPYYARVHGASYADQMRDTFISSDLLLMGHLPHTEPISGSGIIPPEGLEAARQRERITAVRLNGGDLKFEIV